MKKSFKIFAIILLIAILGVGIKYFPQLSILNGYAARTACTCKYVLGRDGAGIINQDLSMSPLNFAQVSFDENAKSASSTVYGLSTRTAYYTEGVGCILVEGDKAIKVNFKTPIDTTDDGYIFINNVDQDIARKVNKVIDPYFKSDGSINEDLTRAILVLHKDTLIAERYASDVNQNTKHLGWSMTKSVLATLIQISKEKSLLKFNDKNLFPEWKDERANISIEELLRMSSGLKWEERYDKKSSATDMLFNASDIVKIAMEPKIEKKEWEYSSGTTNILGALLKNKINDQNKYLNLPYEWLYRPIGMDQSFIETDEEGNYIYSSYMYGTARDWVRFGRLYLNRGNWLGKQIFSPDWIDFINKETPGSNGRYGAHFWLNKRGVKWPDVPHDAYSADGYQGQLVCIIPSKDLVVVRLGLSTIDENKLIKNIIDATQ
jgi:CubicO group peptidase (beta-lactamase class C family)